MADGRSTMHFAVVAYFRPALSGPDERGEGAFGPLKFDGCQDRSEMRLPSRHATEGPDRAPHRAFYYAMGLTKEQIHQPFVGVATCWNEAAPCNIALMRQAQAVKLGSRRRRDARANSAPSP